jgi:molybdate transport system regulatory protein
MVHIHAPRRARPRLFVPHVKFWLEVGDRNAFCHGLSDMLQAIERTGSIKYAASEIGRSYRYVWGKIKRVERAIGTPLVATQVGGTGAKRSALTDAARRLVADFRAVRIRLIQVAEQEFARRWPSSARN